MSPLPPATHPHPHPAGAAQSPREYKSDAAGPQQRYNLRLLGEQYRLGFASSDQKRSLVAQILSREDISAPLRRRLQVTREEGGDIRRDLRARGARSCRVVARGAVLGPIRVSPASPQEVSGCFLESENAAVTSTCSGMF